MQTIVEKGLGKYVVAAIVFLMAAGMATVVSAQDTGGLVTCTGPDCDFCTFIAMVERVAQFIVGLLIIVSVIMLAWTGIEMAAAAAGGNADVHQKLKERMLNIVIGFLLIIAAWTIVDTVLKALVDPGQFEIELLNPVASVESLGLCKEQSFGRSTDLPNVQDSSNTRGYGSQQ